GAAAFVKPDGDELFAAGRANRLPHGLRPLDEPLLREQVEVMHRQGMPAAIDAARREIFVGWSGNGRAQRGHVPRVGDAVIRAVDLAEVLAPALRLEAVAV